jgi:hypothetical protein
MEDHPDSYRSHVVDEAGPSRDVGQPHVKEVAGVVHFVAVTKLSDSHIPVCVIRPGNSHLVADSTNGSRGLDARCGTNVSRCRERASRALTEAHHLSPLGRAVQSRQGWRLQSCMLAQRAEEDR